MGVKRPLPPQSVKLGHDGTGRLRGSGKVGSCGYRSFTSRRGARVTISICGWRRKFNLRRGRGLRRRRGAGVQAASGGGACSPLGRVVLRSLRPRPARAGLQSPIGAESPAMWARAWCAASYNVPLPRLALSSGAGGVADLGGAEESARVRACDLRIPSGLCGSLGGPVIFPAVGANADLITPGGAGVCGDEWQAHSVGYLVRCWRRRAWVARDEHLREQ
jgi:hypothetical protein